MQFEGFSAVIAMFVFLAIPIGIATLIIGRTSRFAHRKRQLIQNIIIAEYEPPDGLSPAEVGYLFDSRFNKTELMATLVDLEQKGLVEINYSNIDGLKLNRKTSEIPANLKDHEKFVLANLASQANLTLYSLRNMPAFKKSVKKSLFDQGYIKSQKETINYYARRTFIAYLLITVPLFFWLISASKGDFILMIVAFFFIFIISFPFFLGLYTKHLSLRHGMRAQPA